MPPISPGTQFHRQGMAEADHRLAGSQHLGGLVDLGQGLVALQGDHLAVQAQFAHPHLFAAAHAGQADADDGTVDLLDEPLGGVCSS